MKKKVHESPANSRLCKLDDDQLMFFRTFGYVVLKQLFTNEELALIDREFANAMEEQYPHRPYDGTVRHWTPMMDEATPFFGSLLEDPRFMTIAMQLYGEDALGIIVDANRYTGDTRWHRDTHTVLQYGVKFAFYLDPVDGESGARRVIPSTHRLPDNTDFADRVKPLAIGEVPACALRSEPGDVVAFDLRLWHSSLGGGEDRRMCTVVYYGNPKSEAEEEALRDLGEKIPKFSLEQFDCKRRYLYSSQWLSNPGGNRDRQRWIERLREIGFLNPPGMVEGS